MAVLREAAATGMPAPDRSHRRSRTTVLASNQEGQTPLRFNRLSAARRWRACAAEQKGPLPLEKHPAKVKPASGQKNGEEPVVPGKMVAKSLIALGKMES
ncbi:hypothetical protein [Microbulbifer variabilis]|uniref:hypothetical protein n=1 Tax=Microbulbifer variabilis TaxID=266805 RepID=UPI001CFD98DD|nr:hypothetical protein [Microbulbifer variabilis]